MHFYNFINKRFRFLDPLTYTYPFYSEYAFFPTLLISNLDFRPLNQPQT